MNGPATFSESEIFSSTTSAGEIEEERVFSDISLGIKCFLFDVQ